MLGIGRCLHGVNGRRSNDSRAIIGAGHWVLAEKDLGITREQLGEFGRVEQDDQHAPSRKRKTNARVVGYVEEAAGSAGNPDRGAGAAQVTESAEARAEGENRETRST